MKSRPTPVVVALLTVVLFSFSGFAQGTMDRHKSASLEGTTGLFKTWDAEAIRRGEFKLSFGYDRTNRDPGQLTVGNAIVGAAVGLADRFEVFASMDVQRHITADNVEIYRAGLKPNPATVPGGTGEPYFTQAAPYMDVDRSNGRSDVRLGVKFNLMSEGRGDVVSTGVAGFFVIPGYKNTIGLNRGLSSGAFQGGFSWLLSKTTADFIRLHLNLGSNFYTDTEIDGRTLAELQNEFIYRFGAEFPAHKPYRIIAELSGFNYYGDTPDTGLNPSNPLDLIVGMRVHPRDWIVLGAGYQASLKHIGDGAVPGALAADYHGFVIQGAFGKCRNDPPKLACTAAKPTILQEDTTKIRVNTVDPEGESLTYAWDSIGGEITGSGDTVTFDATNTAPGNYTVSVVVADRKHAVSCSTEIAVLKKNYPPTVAIEPATSTVTQGESAVFTAKASDPNNDPLTYVWTVNDHRLAASGPKITFGSEGRAPGKYDIMVAVSDGEASAASFATVTVR